MERRKEAPSSILEGGKGNVEKKDVEKEICSTRERNVGLTDFDQFRPFFLCKNKKHLTFPSNISKRNDKLLKAVLPNYFQ